MRIGTSLRHYPVALASIVLALSLLAISAPPRWTTAQFVDSATSNGSTVTLDVLQPPSNLDASPLSLFAVQLTWNPSPDAYTAGYRIYRRAAGQSSFVQIGQVGAGTTNFTDNTIGLSLLPATYVVRAFYQNWQSLDSNGVTCIAALVILCP